MQRIIVNIVSPEKGNFFNLLLLPVDEQEFTSQMLDTKVYERVVNLGRMQCIFIAYANPGIYQVQENSFLPGSIRYPLMVSSAVYPDLVGAVWIPITYLSVSTDVIHSASSIYDVHPTCVSVPKEDCSQYFQEVRKIPIDCADTDRG